MDRFKKQNEMFTIKYCLLKSNDESSALCVRYRNDQFQDVVDEGSF